METTTRYRRTDSVSFTELDGEIICLNLEAGQYVGMRDVGQTIWERLDEPRGFDDLLQHVTAEYEVSPDVAASDINAFLSQLVEAGLVEAV
jgi:hypothetical protein